MSEPLRTFRVAYEDRRAIRRWETPRKVGHVFENDEGRWRITYIVTRPPRPEECSGPYSIGAKYDGLVEVFEYVNAEYEDQGFTSEPDAVE